MKLIDRNPMRESGGPNDRLVRSQVIDCDHRLNFLNGSYRAIELKNVELVECRLWADNGRKSCGKCQFKTQFGPRVGRVCLVGRGDLCRYGSEMRPFNTKST